MTANKRVQPTCRKITKSIAAQTKTQTTCKAMGVQGEVYLKSIGLNP